MDRIDNNAIGIEQNVTQGYNEIITYYNSMKRNRSFIIKF
jgi:hypothetical protein